MATKRKSPPKRPARPSKPRSTGGARVSGSANVHIHVLSGLFSHFSLFRSGGGGRGKGGGLFKRLTGLARRAAKEMQGKPSAGGKAPAGGRSRGDSEGFDRFKASRPDLFDEGQGGELDVTEDGPDGMDSWEHPSERERWEADEEARQDRYRRAGGAR